MTPDEELDLYFETLKSDKGEAPAPDKAAAATAQAQPQRQQARPRPGGPRRSPQDVDVGGGGSHGDVPEPGLLGVRRSRLHSVWHAWLELGPAASGSGGRAGQQRVVLGRGFESAEAAARARDRWAAWAGGRGGSWGPAAMMHGLVPASPPVWALARLPSMVYESPLAPWPLAPSPRVLGPSLQGAPCGVWAGGWAGAELPT
jgi:hypothetical protein